MKRRGFLFAAAAACVFLASFCAEEHGVADGREPRVEPAEPTAQAVAMKTFSRSDQGTVPVLTPGESFAVRLDENPTTGYIWEVETLTAGVLELEREEFVQEPTDPEVVGRGGTKVFVFKTRDSGTGELALRHHRPWLKGDPLDRFVLKVEVRADE